MFQKPQEYLAEFKKRQDCPFIESDDRCVLIFENGARIEARNAQGEFHIGAEVEPPFRDEEDSLRRQLAYWKMRHEREYFAWFKARTELLQTTTNVQTGLDVPLPTDSQLAALEKGKALCDGYAERIADISQRILAQPRLVELARQKAQLAADRAAKKELGRILHEKLAALTTAEPKTLENPALSQ